MAGPIPQRKELGQHFLRDGRIARRIVESAGVEPGHRVLEIGPGAGVLTRELVAAVGETGHVTAVEFDDRFADEIEAQDWANVSVVRGDALHVDLGGPYDAIVANLPYQISGPITARLLDRLADPDTAWGVAVLMYQREFAQRLLAGAGSKQFGRLSVHAARRCVVSKVRDVAPGCFDPPPKVQSMVVRLDPHADAPFEVVDEAIWRAVVDGSFQQRRKQLRNTIPAALRGRGITRNDEAVRAILADRGIADARPEAVEPTTFAAVANAIAGSP